MKTAVYEAKGHKHGEQRFDIKLDLSPKTGIILYNSQSVRISILISSAIRNNAGWYTKNHPETNDSLNEFKNVLYW